MNVEQVTDRVTEGEAFWWQTHNDAESPTYRKGQGGDCIWL